MKSNARKKFLALLAAGSVAVAGVAWAAVTGNIVSNTPVTGTADFNASGAVAFNLSTPKVNLLGDTLLLGHGALGFGYNAFNAADAGTIVLQDGEELDIKPGKDGTTPKNIGNPSAPTAPAAGFGYATGGAGVLRVKGGTTNVYAAFDNYPDNTAAPAGGAGTGSFNAYSGGTFLVAGRLNVAHSNALGLGPITLASDSTFGVIETSNVDIGGTAPDGISLNNPSLPGGMHHQNIVIRRYDKNTTKENVRSVTFDVPTVAGVNTLLRVYTGIAQEDQTLGTANFHGAAPDYPATGIVKTGTGTMQVHDQGIVNFGGTHVKEGTLFVDGGTTNYFVGELGATWNFPWNLTLAAETSSAKVNYDAFIKGSPAAGGIDRPTTPNALRILEEPTPAIAGVRTYSLVPAYMNTMVADGSWALEQGGGYTNPLTIDAGATVKVNRDQFIGDLNGGGTFEIQHWAKAGAEVIPQVTMQVNNTLSTYGGKNADFSGNIVGKVNLVIDNPVQATGSSVNNADQSMQRVNYFPRTQALTGTNNITAGDTFVKDGTLSINKSGNIGPGTLRIGMYPAGYEHDEYGVEAGNETFRGFGDTMNVATFHGGDDINIEQETLVYAPGRNVGGAIAAKTLTPMDATVPADSTRSVSWYGNNPENVANLTDTIGVDGRYNTVGPNVNLAATRKKTVAFSDITLHGENGAVPTIAQFSGRNDIRYVMRNAMAINDRLDENSDWDGTVAFADKWTLEGATSARMFGFDVKNGVLHLAKKQQAGYAVAGLRQGATLSLGEEARDFDAQLAVVFEDDARIRVVPKTSDLAASLADAQTKDAVFFADNINYTGLGAGSDHMDKRLVVQIDLSNIGANITDQWIKVVGSHNADNWNNIHFYSSSAGQTEHMYKVKVAQPGNMVFDGNISVTPYCDENEYNIYVHIQKIDQPVPGEPTLPTDSDMVAPAAGNPTTLAEGEAVVITGTIDDSVYDVDTLAVVTTPATDWVLTVDPAGDAGSVRTFKVTGTMPNSAVKYYFTAKKLDDGNTYQSPVSNMALPGGEAPSSSSSGGSGCDAGFGAFALLGAAGALVLRRKD